MDWKFDLASYLLGAAGMAVGFGWLPYLLGRDWANARQQAAIDQQAELIDGQSKVINNLTRDLWATREERDDARRKLADATQDVAPGEYPQGTSSGVNQPIGKLTPSVCKCCNQDEEAPTAAPCEPQPEPRPVKYVFETTWEYKNLAPHQNRKIVSTYATDDELRNRVFEREANQKIAEILLRNATTKTMTHVTEDHRERVTYHARRLF